MRQYQHRVAVLLGTAALACASSAAPAQAAASTPLKPVSTAITQQKSGLGKKAAKDLKGRVDKAKRDYKARKWCATVKDLSGVVNATKKYKTPAKSTAGVVVADAAREAQQTIFGKYAKSTKSCGLAAPKVTVASVPHETKSIAGIDGGPARSVAAFKGEGTTMEFVTDEVLVSSNDKPAVEKFAAKWKGKVVDFHDAPADGVDTWLLRIDASGADTSGLPADLRTLDPASRGTAKTSDQRSLKLLAVVADAATHGLKVSLNTIVGGTAVEDRTTAEKDGGDGFGQWYNASPGPIAVGEAWRTLLIGGAASRHVKLAVVDGGFATTPATIADFGVRTGDWGQGQNLMQCTGGNQCLWHGTNVASAAAATIDNGVGVAGVAGQVADVQAVQMQGATMFDSIDAIYEAFEAGAKVINISSGYEMDALVSFINIPFEDATQEAREQGALVVASAGNDDRDVDAEDCFIVCWEEEWIAPCENDAVLCVGGVGSDLRRQRAPKGKEVGSNFGFEWTENAATSDVDIFAPWTTAVGADGSTNNNQTKSGTSFSSPFVAGVATMMLAANPSLTPQQLEQGLKETASSSPDKEVSRIVNADAAIKWAFPSSVFPPFVKIDRAATQSGGPYGGFGGLQMQAKVYTVFGSPSCCSYVWSSPEDGQLGTGASINGVLSSAGKRTVTVKATNGAGLSHTDSIEITGTNQAPTAAIASPFAGDKLYRGIPYKFEGSGLDPNQLGGVACGSLAWEITGTGVPTQTATGCQPQFTFAQNGARSVKLTVTDEAGGKASQTRSFSVVDPPLNAPPIVSILQPDNAQSLDPGTTYVLKASAVDPDGTETIAGTWTLKDGSTTYTIGTGNQINWKPGDTVPFNCGGGSATLIFTATDSNGTSKDEIGIFIPYPVC